MTLMDRCDRFKSNSRDTIWCSFVLAEQDNWPMRIVATNCLGILTFLERDWMGCIPSVRISLTLRANMKYKYNSNMFTLRCDLLVVFVCVVCFGIILSPTANPYSLVTMADRIPYTSWKTNTKVSRALIVNHLRKYPKERVSWRK